MRNNIETMIKDKISPIKQIVELVNNKTLKVKNVDGKNIFSPVKVTKDGRIIYPTETDRETIKVLLGTSYLVKTTDGEYLANYNVILETFSEADNSIDFKEFCDVRSGERNSKTIFQTDSIVSSKGNETNSTADDTAANSKTRKKQIRNVEVLLTKEFGTQTTEINTRNMSSVAAFDLQASDMEQHARMNKLISNRFIIKLMMKSAKIIDTGIEFNENAVDIDAEYIKLGKAVYPIIKNEIQNFKEYMTIYRPGGFTKQDIFSILSPKVARACVDYQTSLPASDKGFTVAAEGELYNYSIEGIPVHESGLLKGGQRLEVMDRDGNMTIEYENDENIEVMLGIKNYTKYVQADPYVNSSPMVINKQMVQHVIGQYTEGMHNGVVIIEGLYKAITFKRTTTSNQKIPTIDSLTADDTGTSGDGDIEVSFKYTKNDGENVVTKINGQVVSSSPTTISGTSGEEEAIELTLDYEFDGSSQDQINESIDFTPLLGRFQNEAELEDKDEDVEEEVVVKETTNSFFKKNKNKEKNNGGITI